MKIGVGAGEGSVGPGEGSGGLLLGALCPVGRKITPIVGRMLTAGPLELDE